MSGPRPRRQERLDRILVLRGLAASRGEARALVMAGRVRSGGRRLDKAGRAHPLDIPLEVDAGRRFVGRGAHKLRAALAEFGIDPAGRVALDVGASTGGFTQVLLEAGARRVIALDVGRGQLDWSLRNHERVVVMEGVNARHLQPSDLPERPTLAAVDVSFISLELVLPAVARCLEPGGEMASLVKPQFEVGRGNVGRGGIVRDPGAQREVLERMISFARRRRWSVRGLIASPILGAEGNREFFLHLALAGAGSDLRERLDALFGAGP